MARPRRRRGRDEAPRDFDPRRFRFPGADEPGGAVAVDLLELVAIDRDVAARARRRAAPSGKSTAKIAVAVMAAKMSHRIMAAIHHKPASIASAAVRAECRARPWVEYCRPPLCYTCPARPLRASVRSIIKPHGHRSLSQTPEGRARRPQAARPFALAYRGRIALALIALAVASVATLTLPLAVRRVVDRGFSESSGHILHAYFGMLLVVVAVLALASAARYYLVITLGERVVADLRAAVFRRLAALDPSYFDATQSGEIVSRLTADTTQVKSAFGVSISIALRNSFLFFGAIAMMMVTSLKLSVLVLLAIPVIVLPLILSGRGVRRRARLAQDRLADAAAYAAEAIGAVRTMFAFGMERATADRFAAAAEEAFAAARRSTKARAI